MIDLNHSRTLAARLFAAALLLAGACSALAGVHYVDVNSTNATPPYTNWTTAATNIQDAVDAAAAADEIVVTNGTYATGGRNGSRVDVDSPLSVRSVNGPQFTTIDGGRTARCAFSTNMASFSGFTLINGSSTEGGAAYGGTLSNCILTLNSAIYGGGAYNCTLNDCTLTGNSAQSSGNGSFGGGAYACTLNNCTLTSNSVSGSGPVSFLFGGGAYRCTLNTCTLTGNSARGSVGFIAAGGGANNCTLYNCIVYFNTAAFRGPNFDGCSLNYCSTTPQPTNGVGNITNAPLFVDTNGWANLRLQPNSPCINAGNNSYVTNATDLDGNPRISGGVVDMGAYEYQWPQLTIAPSGPNVVLRWPTNNAGYDYTGFVLQCTTNLGSPVWSTNSPAPVVIGGQNTVTNPMSGAQKFYQLKQ